MLDAELAVHTSLLRRPDELCSVAAREGYVFLRGLLDPRRLRALEHDILAICAHAGWLETGTATSSAMPRAGVLHVEPEPDFMTVYDEVQRLEAFHALSHDASLLALFGALFGETPLVHARNIARIMFPGAPVTPPHQDHVHIRGTPQTWTAWIVLNDCPRALGGLALVPRSHALGLLPVRPAKGAGGVGVDVDDFAIPFHTADFQLGDVLVFHSLTVHKALPNVGAKRLRLSVDFRYQPASHPFALDSFEPHYGRPTWNQIYSGWSSTEFQYYWRRSLPSPESERAAANDC